MNMLLNKNVDYTGKIINFKRSRNRDIVVKQDDDAIYVRQLTYTPFGVSEHIRKMPFVYARVEYVSDNTYDLVDMRYSKITFFAKDVDMGARLAKHFGISNGFETTSFGSIHQTMIRTHKIEEFTQIVSDEEIFTILDIEQTTEEDF